MACFKLGWGDALALARLSGEGLGTAYEYCVKARVIERQLERRSIKSVLVCGLPEKYGFSLDFPYLARQAGAKLTVVDERPETLKKFEAAVAASPLLEGLDYCVKAVGDLSAPGLSASFDVSFNMEVLQRLSKSRRQDFTASVAKLAPLSFSFAPNAANGLHNRVSGLKSLSLEELIELNEAAGLKVLDSGFIDLPPFPPGLRQGESAGGGKSVLDVVLTPPLKFWMNLEGFYPNFIKGRLAHIVYTVALKDE